MKFMPINLTRFRAPETQLWSGALRHGLSRVVACPLLFFSAWGLVLVQPCAGHSGIFTETGSFGVARSQHTATLLPNGKVIVAGGYGTGGQLASALLYDPASGTWSSTVPPVARYIHTATLLANGKVLVAGGNGGSGQIASAELYDPVLGTWTATGSLGVARSRHTATLLPNGRVLVAGNASSSASAELYDPASGTWSATGSLFFGRFGHTATLLLNGKVLVAGGFRTGGQIANAELYDPVLGTWTATGSLATARQNHTATLLPNGKVLVAGGNGGIASAELYNPVLGTWTATGSLATARQNHAATLLPDGKLLVTGGQVTSGGSSSSAELYDPSNGTWTATGSLIATRYDHSATSLPNGQVLVVGGYNGSTYLASAELYAGPAKPPDLLNISTRMRVLTGDQVLIGGFIITGTDLKRVLIRGMGPSVKGVGVLSDPTLELHQGSTTLTTNDNWKMRSDGTSQQADIEATTIPPSSDLESAILAMLNPGAYTAILAGKNGETGVGLVEVYDLGQGANSRLANISTRGFVDTGDNVMIGGFIVGGGSGGGSARVLLRALGPSVPVAGALGNPMLELHDGDGVLVALNDNWRSFQESEIIATGIPPTNDLESALVGDFAPGGYTAIVRGVNKTTGVALVEAYHLGQISIPTPSPSATPSPSPSATPSPSPTSSPSATPSPSPPPAARFANLSTRDLVGTGDAVSVNAFIITGFEPMRVIVRGLGPSLTSIPNRLQDPVIEVRDSSGGLIASNDNWRSDQEAEIIATGIPPTNDLESAIVMTLPANGSAYAAIVRGVDDGTGIGLNELYDLSSVSSRLTAVGTRGHVSVGKDVLISGLTIQDGGAVLVRLLGPSLPLVGALGDPTLELRDGSGALIVANDNWRSDQEAEIIATGIPPSNDLESAIVRDLVPGSYTAVASGVNSTTGIGYMQFYSLPHSGPVLTLTP